MKTNFQFMPPISARSSMNPKGTLSVWVEIEIGKTTVGELLTMFRNDYDIDFTEPKFIFNGQLLPLTRVISRDLAMNLYNVLLTVGYVTYVGPKSPIWKFVLPTTRKISSYKRKFFVGKGQPKAAPPTRVRSASRSRSRSRKNKATTRVRRSW